MIPPVPRDLLMRRQRLLVAAVRSQVAGNRRLNVNRLHVPGSYQAIDLRKALCLLRDSGSAIARTIKVRHGAKRSCLHRLVLPFSFVRKRAWLPLPWEGLLRKVQEGRQRRNSFRF